MEIQFKWWKSIGLFLLIVGWTSLFITSDHLNYPIVAVGYCIVGIVMMYIERKPTKYN